MPSTSWLAFLSPSVDVSREPFLMPLGRPRSKPWGLVGQSMVSEGRFPALFHHLTSQCLCPPRLWNWKDENDHPGALPLGRED